MKQVELINYLNGMLELLDNNDLTSAGDVNTIGKLKKVVTGYYNNEYSNKDTFSLSEVEKITVKHDKALQALQLKITELELDKQNLRYLVEGGTNRV